MLLHYRKFKLSTQTEYTFLLAFCERFVNTLCIILWVFSGKKSISIFYSENI